MKSAGIPKTFKWTMSDDSAVELNNDEMIQFGMSVMGYVDACFNHARALREQIDAAETVEELQEIEIEEGWP